MNRNLRLGQALGLGLVVLSVLLASATALAGAAPARKAPAAPALPSCTKCHQSLQTVLPQGHVPTEGKDITACLTCHAPADAQKPAPNPFSARLHRAHENGKTHLDCTTCHTWQPGKSFGLPGVAGSYGAPTMDDFGPLKDAVYAWTNPAYLGGAHAKKGVSCGACHGRTLPSAGDRVEADQCFKCHGGPEELAKRSVNPAYPDRNPHQSHLGEVACGACHKVHAPSKVYCIGCHPKFDLTIPGAAAQ